MTHLSGHDRSQILLLPEVVDEYVGPENPVRFMMRLSTGWILRRHSLAVLSQRRRVASADLLKLYIYGYLNRVRSSRRLEAETLQQTVRN
jgi:transposase